MTDARKVAFRAEASLAANTLVPRRQPDGRREGAEWIATNPTRTDERRGSFMVNLRTGTDFALEVSGGNLTSLAAYLFRVKHGQAAARIADALGAMSVGTGRRGSLEQT
jgi:hypothetical protein